MQTFLPYRDFALSAACLDRQRLGKQRVEVLQLLTSPSNHPASRMWRSHEHQLCLYGLAICDEWLKRGYNDSCKLKIALQLVFYAPSTLPTWFGGQLHANHRARLMAKAPEWYSQFGWTETPTEENYWPV